MVRHTLKTLAANAARFSKCVWPFWYATSLFHQICLQTLLRTFMFFQMSQFAHRLFGYIESRG